nr:hypothetical protein [Cereibacter sediminicola]
MNWASAGVAAQVDRIILEEAFGCDVELVPGDTMPTLTRDVGERALLDAAVEGAGW